MDGSIIFPELGTINVFGNSITDIRKKIKQLIELSYVGVDVSVSLEALAAKKINIIGAVKNPGTYIVNPFSTITSTFALAPKRTPISFPRLASRTTKFKKTI